MTSIRLPGSQGPSRDIDTFDFSGMAQRLRPRPAASRIARRAGRISREELIGITAAAGFVIVPLMASRRRRGRGQGGR